MPVSRKSFRIALIIVVATVLIGAGVAYYFYRQARDYPYRAHAGTGKTIEVVIESGMSFPAIAKRLEAAGVIDKPRWFRLYAMNEGATTKVRTGTYQLRDNMTPKAVLEELLAGVPDVTVSVTIPEGLHILEVFAILADKAGDGSKKIADAGELDALCRDPEYLAEHGIDAPTCEGYLFPDTYRFRVPTSPRAVLDKLIARHRVVWDQVRRANPEGVDRIRDKLGWTDHQILILASIVEKEAVVDKERPTIAQVFINRLTSPRFNPKRLETDPTIRYGCTVPRQKSKACQDWDVTDRLYRKQLDDTDNPYNTYQHEGLPPGPIGNPGRRSLEAAVAPDKSRYLFFVSRNDGTHVFSKTYAEHTRWVNKYQR